MPKKKKEAQKESTDFIKWFSDLNKDSGNIAGGKGANLSEIYNMDVPVPPGFVVTAQAYRYFIEKNNIDDKIIEILGMIDYENTKQLDEKTNEIRELILKSKLPKNLEEDILEAYEHLDVDEFDTAKGTALDILKTSKEPIFVAVRSSATTEDLAEASFAGQQDSFLNIKGQVELIKHIKKCFASLFTSRATYYRNKKGFKHEKANLAVVVQKMINSDKSGVIFSKNPTGNKEEILIEAVWGLGEGIVSGKITPDNYMVSNDSEITDKEVANKKIAITRDSSGSKAVVKLRDEKANHQVLKDHEIKKLAEIALKLEKHYQKPQDIEFAIENEEIFIVQTRPITTLGGKSSGTEIKELKGEVVLTGLAASPGIGVGKIKIVETMDDLQKIKKGDVLVTKMTNPDMVVSMQKSSAIVTDEGGLTSHAAIVSREMGIPAVVGTQEATTKLKENEIITINGFTGKVYKGKVSETVQKEVLPVTAKTKTEIKVIVDLPSFAERAAKTKLKKVGLTRLEGIIAESGKHPRFFVQQNKIKDYEEIIYKGIKGIAKHFNEIWVRTSDIRTDEYQNLEGAPSEVEANPMLGFHGIRYSLKNLEILKAELNAMRRVASEGTTIGILMPQVILVDELKKVKQIIQEINFQNVKVGIMIETPAAVQLIKALCDEGIDFVSFGTNDLTQYMLAIDRGNEEVQDLYDEMHPAILYQLDYVIRVCKRNNVKTSICGQAGSKKPMVKFLVEKGIDSISVNADIAADIAVYVAEIEQKIKLESGEEPRQYQPQKKEKNEEQIDEQIENKEGTQREIEQESETVDEQTPKTQETNNNEPSITNDSSNQDYNQKSEHLEEIIEEENDEDIDDENPDDIQDPSIESSKENDEDEILDIF